MQTQTHKLCKDCQEVKPHEEFPVHKRQTARGADGKLYIAKIQYQPYCKPCSNDRNYFHRTGIRRAGLISRYAEPPLPEP